MVNIFALQVGDLLGRYPDLMDGFNEFLARCEKNGNCPHLILSLISVLINSYLIKS